MNKVRIMPLLFLLMMVFPLIRADAAASERNIYVGDIIELKISSQKLTEEDIRERFSDFEIVGLVEKTDHFIIKLRTFETGEKRVVLGDKEIVIVVKSALQEIQSDGPMEGSLEPAAGVPVIPWLGIFIAMLAVALVTGFILVKDRSEKRSKAQLTPYQHFLSQSKGLSYDDSEFFVKQTSYFKEYIEAVYHCSIKGMTSSEILYTVDKLPRMQNMEQELGRWLSECDYFKFTGTAASVGKKQEMQRKLAKLVGRIDAENRAVNGSAKGTAGRAEHGIANQAIQGVVSGDAKGSLSGTTQGIADRAEQDTANRAAQETAGRAEHGIANQAIQGVVSGDAKGSLSGTTQGIADWAKQDTANRAAQETVKGTEKGAGS